jgi:hypothetical protein
MVCATAPAKARASAPCQATVAAFLAHEADRGSRAPTPTGSPTWRRNSEHVRATLRGIRRTVEAAPVHKAPILAERACAMALSAPEGLKGTRDRALLLGRR